jgi:hypothetical protein
MLVLAVCPSGCVGVRRVPEWMSYACVSHVLEWMSMLMLAVPDYMHVLVLAVCPSG